MICLQLKATLHSLLSFLTHSLGFISHPFGFLHKNLLLNSGRDAASIRGNADLREAICLDQNNFGRGSAREGLRQADRLRECTRTRTLGLLIKSRRFK